VPHLNELNDKFSEAGLSIIGVTGESPSKTDPWVKAKGAKYAYGYDKGRKLSRALGVSGIPHAFLVDPGGTIVWHGHPGNLTPDIIAKHLDGALKKPVWEWPDSTKKLRAALKKGAFGKALSEADALSQSDDELLQKIASVVGDMVRGKVTALKSLKEDGDYLAVVTRGAALAKALKGYPEGEEAAAILAEVKKDPMAKKVIRAQKALGKIEAGMPKLRSAKKLEAAIHKVKKLTAKLSETHAARQGQALVAKLEKKMKALQRR